MVDPLTDVVALLQPGAPVSKIVNGAGRWSVRRSEYGRPFFCVILDGSSRLAVDGHAPIVLEHGDFVLIPSARDFTMSGLDTAAPEDGTSPSVSLRQGEIRHDEAEHREIRHGAQDGPPDVRLLVGYCVFGSPDAALLVSLLPQLVHVRGEPRLSTLVRLVVEESRARRPGRDVILARLLEVLLIEALRSTAGSAAPPGLLRALADDRVALALRRMHESPARRWTVAELAEEAALSRSAFFERFHRAVGLAPIAYLLAWRMALAKSLLRRRDGDLAEVAERVGYGSASAFSVAFTRHVGLPPTRYAREPAALAPSGPERPLPGGDAATVPGLAGLSSRRGTAG